ILLHRQRSLLRISSRPRIRVLRVRGSSLLSGLDLLGCRRILDLWRSLRRQSILLLNPCVRQNLGFCCVVLLHGQRSLRLRLSSRRMGWGRIWCQSMRGNSLLSGRNLDVW
ncbi:MAG: hypothetical protein ACK55Z_10630, partial [bacterium]